MSLAPIHQRAKRVTAFRARMTPATKSRSASHNRFSGLLWIATQEAEGSGNVEGCGRRRSACIKTENPASRTSAPADLRVRLDETRWQEAF